MTQLDFFRILGQNYCSKKFFLGEKSFKILFKFFPVLFVAHKIKGERFEVCVAPSVT